MTELTIGITTINRPAAVEHCLETIQETVEVDHELVVVDATQDADFRPDYDAYDTRIVVADGFLSAAGAQQRLVDECDTEYLHIIHDDITPRRGAVEALLERVHSGPADVATGVCYDPDGPRPVGRVYELVDDGGRPVVEKRPVLLEDVKDREAVPIDHGEPMFLADTSIFYEGVGFDPEFDFLMDQWDFFMSCHEADVQVQAVIGASYDHHDFEYRAPSPGAEKQDIWADRTYFYKKWGYWPGVS